MHQRRLSVDNEYLVTLKDPRGHEKLRENKVKAPRKYLRDEFDSARYRSNMGEQV